MNYPKRGTTYTANDIVNKLQLDDCPFFCFNHNGHKAVVQTVHLTNEELLSVPGFAESLWRYSHTTQERCPIFNYADAADKLSTMLDIEPAINMFGEKSDTELHVTPKGFPRTQFYADPEKCYKRRTPEVVEEIPTEHAHAVRYCRSYIASMSVEDCVKAYATYRLYRDEGQTDLISRQYAGLL